MDDDHCVITTLHRICEIPIAANKRQFSVFVNMSAAWVLPNGAANIKKMISNAGKRGKVFQKYLSARNPKIICANGIKKHHLRRKSFNKLRNSIPILYTKSNKFIPSEFAIKLMSQLQIKNTL